MIKHIVMWRLADLAEGTNKAENAKKMKALLEALKPKIPEVMSLSVGINSNPAETFDIVLISEFKNKEGLNAYQNHPAHKEVVEFVKKIRVDRAAVDFEF